jgi:hypothetical protein
MQLHPSSKNIVEGNPVYVLGCITGELLAFSFSAHYPDISRDTHRIAFHTVDDMYHWLCDFRTVLKHDPDDHIDEQKLEWDLELPAEDDPIYGIWMKLRGVTFFMGLELNLF